MPGKKTVNLKKFLMDFRTGASEAELMARHGLDKRGLQNMLRVLKERQLVPAEDLEGHRNSPQTRVPSKPTVPLSTSAHESEPDASLAQPEEDQDSQSKCSQCGARVTDIMLTCPECGHVLPGESRWSRMQPERSALSRVPPWLIGCFIALPIAIGMYFAFKHVIIPLSAASIHQRALAVAQPKPVNKAPSPGTTAKKPAQLPVYEQTQLLIGQGILQAVNADFTAFTVTERWYDLPRDGKVALVTQLGAALLASGMNAPFEVKDDSGILGARVNLRTIELLDRYGFAETIERGDTDSSQQHSAEQGTGEVQAPPHLESTGRSDSKRKGIDK